MNQSDQNLTVPGDAAKMIEEGAVVNQMRSKFQQNISQQNKRVLADVEKRCIEECRLAGATCYYGWGSGKDAIEGESVELAMILARNWGHCSVEPAEVVETDSAYLIHYSFIDFQTNYSFTRPFRMDKKWTVYGKFDAQRKADIRFNIGASKAARNAILKAIPSWLVTKCMHAAKEGVREDLTAYITKLGLPTAKDKYVEKYDTKKTINRDTILPAHIITKFGENFIIDCGLPFVREKYRESLIKLKIDVEMVEAKYGKKYPGAWDLDLLIILKGDIIALQDGAEDVASLYPMKDKPEQNADTGPETLPGPEVTDEKLSVDPGADHQGVAGKLNDNEETGEIMDGDQKTTIRTLIDSREVSTDEHKASIDNAEKAINDLTTTKKQADKIIEELSAIPQLKEF